MPMTLTFRRAFGSPAAPLAQEAAEGGRDRAARGSVFPQHLSDPLEVFERSSLAAPPFGAIFDRLAGPGRLSLSFVLAKVACART
jgi:hypothetical protein